MNKKIGAFQRSNEISKNEDQLSKKSESDANILVAQLNAQRNNPGYVAARLEVAKKKIEDNYKLSGSKLRDPHNNETLIRDRGNKITTRSLERRDASTIVDMAEAKGWGSIVVKGTTEFKQKIWIEAQSRGITTKGFSPNRDDIDALKAKLVKDGVVDKETGRLVSKDTQAKKSSVNINNATPKDDRITLVDHGRAPYRNDPNNKPSYFVKLEQYGKETVKWGAGLQKAIENSGAVRGEKIVIRREKERMVTVRNNQGKLVETKRADWNITRDERIAKATTAFQKLIESSVTDPKAKHDLLAAAERYVPKMQEGKKIPITKLYDKRAEKLMEAKRKSDLAREVPERPTPDNAPSHSPGL